MWVDRDQFYRLVEMAAQYTQLNAIHEYTLRQLDKERERADNAVDALLMSKNAVPITPQKPGVPEPHPFDEDPDELKRVLEALGVNPVGTLMTEGVGDAK